MCAYVSATGPAAAAVNSATCNASARILARVRISLSRKSGATTAGNSLYAVPNPTAMYAAARHHPDIRLDEAFSHAASATVTKNSTPMSRRSSRLPGA